VQTIIETHEFMRAAKKLLTESEKEALINLLASNPTAGDLIEGTGGFRKIRLARTGSGKSGGYRVVTFFYNETKPLYLITMYAKNKKENLTKEERNQLKEIADILKN
jgi:hypothetical protein